MNSLLVGTDISELIHSRLSGPFLLIGDMEIDRKHTVFDYTVHSIDLLKGMTYERACDFIEIIDTVFPGGADTLRRQDSNMFILQALLSNPSSLEHLIYPDPKNPASVDAAQKIERILLSPVLRSVLTKPPNFKFPRGVVVADLERLRRFDRLFLAHLLISKFRGQKVIPNFGFYGRDYLSYLIDDNHLIAGVKRLSQLTEALQGELLAIPDRDAQTCSYNDAVTLANEAGLIPRTNEYNDEIARLTARRA